MHTVYTFATLIILNTTGVKEWCPLSALHLFDIIWDIMPDLMHMIKGLLKDHLLKLLLGEASVSKPTKLQVPTKPARGKRQSEVQYRKTLEGWETDIATVEQKNRLYESRWKKDIEVIHIMYTIYARLPVMYTIYARFTVLCTVGAHIHAERCRMGARSE